MTPFCSPKKALVITLLEKFYPGSDFFPNGDSLAIRKQYHMQLYFILKIFVEISVEYVKCFFHDMIHLHSTECNKMEINQQFQNI